MGSVLLVGWDDVSAAEATAAVCPRLAAFRQSAFESQGFSHPVCSQSRQAILFGSYGKKLGTIRDIGTMTLQSYTPPGTLPTLPSVLQSAGYRTALVGKWHCGPSPSGAHWAMAPLERGYQDWLAGTRLNLKSDTGEDYTDWERVDADEAGFTVVSHESQYATQAQLDAALAWWAETSEEPKRFLHVAFNIPHGPFHPPPLSLLAGWPQPTQFSSARQKYLAMLRSADTAFGILLDAVGDCAVFLYTDNGTAGAALPAGTPPAKAKETTFDGGIRVLMLGKWASCPIGFNGQINHLIDIPAGVCATAHVTPPPEWDSKTTGRNYILSEAELADGSIDRACRTGIMKLRQLQGAEDGLVTEELYDLVNDAAEAFPMDLTDPANASALAYFRGKLEASAL